MRRETFVFAGILAASWAVVFAPPGLAQSQPTAPPAKVMDPQAMPDTSDMAPAGAQLAAKALNPISDMISVPFQFNFNVGQGDELALMVQPVVPIKLNEDWNLITRYMIPFFVPLEQGSPRDFTGGDEVNPGAAGRTVSGIGDINPWFLFSPASTGKTSWGIGPTFTIPSATDAGLTSGQFSLGPAFVFISIPQPWLFCLIANHQWSVGGWTDKKVNATYMNPMVMRFFKHGWYLGTSPIMTANWEADSGERWLVPLGMSVGRAFKLAKGGPVNAQIAGYYNVVRPQDVPEWQVRFQVQFLYPK